MAAIPSLVAGTTARVMMPTTRSRSYETSSRSTTASLRFQRLDTGVRGQRRPGRLVVVSIARPALGRAPGRKSRRAAPPVRQGAALLLRRRKVGIGRVWGVWGQLFMEGLQGPQKAALEHQFDGGPQVGSADERGGVGLAQQREELRDHCLHDVAQLELIGRIVGELDLGEDSGGRVEGGVLVAASTARTPLPERPKEPSRRALPAYLDVRS